MATAKDWIKAFRLRTLPLALSGVLVGTSIAASYVELDYAIAGFTLLTAFLLQILSNLANDYGDAVSGVDSSFRKGPDRMVQAGVITREAMKRALIICALLTLTSGLWLLYLAFSEAIMIALLFLIIGLAAIAAAIKYTVGKNPYGYAGFGDLFVYLFFGLVAVIGTAFLQTRTFHELMILPASTMGLLGVGVLNINNIRDVESDKRSGKNSIPVRIGYRKAIGYHNTLLILAMLLLLVYLVLRFQSELEFLPVLSFPLLLLNMRAVATRSQSKLDPLLKQLSLATLLLSVLFAIGQLLA